MDPNRSLKAHICGITPLYFHKLISPQHLIKLTTLTELEWLKKIKNNYICQGKCKSQQTSTHPHTSYCSVCKQIRQRLCDSYHHCQKNPLLELISRITFEYLFDIITLEDIKSRRWLDSRLRDNGHTLRIKICYSRAKKKGLIDPYNTILS
jgi:hypothetical protein